MSQPLPSIVVDKVCKSFGTHQVLCDVSTHFTTGEVTVIIGASRSGKSTLLRALNRLEPHDSGSIRIDGVEVTDDQRTLQLQRCEVGDSVLFFDQGRVAHDAPPADFFNNPGNDRIRTFIGKLGA